MRTLALAAPLVGLLFVACANTPEELPEGRTTTTPHTKFDEIRPTAIVVLKVDAPARDLRQLLRGHLYDELFKKDYSCVKLQSVDKHTLPSGKVDPRKLPYDATFKVKVDTWKPYRGGRYYAASGTATMVHRQGETLLTIKFTNEVFEANVEAGISDDTNAIKLLAARIVRAVPPHPKLSAE